MRTQMRALPREFYAKVVRLRAGGAQTYEIAARLNEPEAKVRKALKFMVKRYRDSLELAGKGNIVVEQAMAVEVSMAQLSSLLKEAARPIERVQIIRLREELREKWFNIVSNLGLVKVEKVGLDDPPWKRLPDEEKRRLVELGKKRLEQARRINAEREAQAAKEEA